MASSEDALLGDGDRGAAAAGLGSAGVGTGLGSAGTGAGLGDGASAAATGAGSGDTAASAEGPASGRASNFRIRSAQITPRPKGRLVRASYQVTGRVTIVFFGPTEPRLGYSAAQSMSRLLSCFLVLGSVSACIGVSQTRSAGGTPGAADVATCRLGTRPADDGLIDDFEDENTQLNVIAGRDGYWWTKHDDKGSSIGPDPFIPSEGGADGSGLALRGTGKTAVGDPAVAWGAGFGVNFLTRQNGVYDASKYVGVSFKAKVGEISTRQIRFAIGDVNTHPNAGVCKVCWNHFSKDLIVTNQWKEFRVLFGEVQQQAGWGEPRPASVTPGKLVSIDWSIAGGQTYDLWIDDIQFLACK